MDDSLVSILVACHNSEQYIDECIKSLLSQTYPKLEIIICDDASQDGTWNKLVELQKCQCHKLSSCQ